MVVRADVWFDHTVNCVYISNDAGATDVACICEDSDRLYHDTNCSGAKDAGEEYIDLNAKSECVGTTTYLDGEGNCDTIPPAHGDGANCAAGEIALGVDAAGAVQGCYEPAEADISDLNHTATAITDGLIIEPDLNEDSGTPTDEDVLTYDATGTNFNWVAQSTLASGTAAALAANGANCAAGEIALGVDAAGAVEGCYEPTEADITDLAHSNSFATHNAPAGTDPVADSGADTLNWTVTSPAVLTGNSTTDTMAWSWSGAFADAQISESSVTQHEGALVAGNANEIQYRNSASAVFDAVNNFEFDESAFTLTIDDGDPSGGDVGTVIKTDRTALEHVIASGSKTRFDVNADADAPYPGQLAYNNDIALEWTTDSAIFGESGEDDLTMAINGKFSATCSGQDGCVYTANSVAFYVDSSNDISASTGTCASAVELTCTVCQISTADANDTAKLFSTNASDATAGVIHHIFNGTANSVRICGATTSVDIQADGGAGDYVTLPAGDAAMCVMFSTLAGYCNVWTPPTT
jgi:hypothetical protein